MKHIELTDEQSRLIAESDGCVEIRDHNNNHLGYGVSVLSPEESEQFAAFLQSVFGLTVSLSGFTSEEIALAKARLASDQPRYSTQEVIDHVQSQGHQ